MTGTRKHPPFNPLNLGRGGTFFPPAGVVVEEVEVEEDEDVLVMLAEVVVAVIVFWETIGVDTVVEEREDVDDIDEFDNGRVIPVEPDVVVVGREEEFVKLME